MLVEDTPKSKQKVALMANALLLPVLAWAINGYLLTRQVLETSWGVALFTSFICAFVIFLVERIIIMSTTSEGMKRFRIVLGVCVALLGSLALDEVIFKSDIDYQLNINKEQFAEIRAKEAGFRFDTLNGMAGRLQSINQGKDNIGVAEQIAINEMDGKGSGVKGAGKIAQKKLDIAANRKIVVELEQRSYDSLIQAKTTELNLVKEKAKAEYKDGLMIRVDSLFQLVFSDWGMAIAYLVLTVLMFCIEFIVVLVKSKTPESNYERRVKLIESIGEKRMQILSSKDSPLIDPGYCLPNAQSARQSLNKNQSLFN
jgi:Na+-transporting methylmalonyl-CoA/oxaloacetate decarboxylase gamma subunit